MSRGEIARNLSTDSTDWHRFGKGWEKEGGKSGTWEVRNIGKRGEGKGLAETMNDGALV